MRCRDESREITIQFGDDPGQVFGSRTADTLRLTDTETALIFEVPELPPTSYAADFNALLDSQTAVPGLVPFFRTPLEDVEPNATELISDPDNPEVQIQVINEAILTALSVRYRASRGNLRLVEVHWEVQPRRQRIWL